MVACPPAPCGHIILNSILSTCSCGAQRHPKQHFRRRSYHKIHYGTANTFLLPGRRALAGLHPCCSLQVKSNFLSLQPPFPPCWATPGTPDMWSITPTSHMRAQAAWHVLLPHAGPPGLHLGAALFQAGSCKVNTSHEPVLGRLSITFQKALSTLQDLNAKASKRQSSFSWIPSSGFHLWQTSHIYVLPCRIWVAKKWQSIDAVTSRWDMFFLFSVLRLRFPFNT